jgi:adenylosuccinate lyase
LPARSRAYWACIQRVRQALQIIDERLKALKDRMVRLEADERQVVTEARSAASTAAANAVGSFISEAATRITRLEGRTDQLEQKRLPPA